MRISGNLPQCTHAQNLERILGWACACVHPALSHASSRPSQQNSCCATLAQTAWRRGEERLQAGFPREPWPKSSVGGQPSPAQRRRMACQQPLLGFPFKRPCGEKPGDHSQGDESSSCHPHQLRPLLIRKMERNNTEPCLSFLAWTNCGSRPALARQSPARWCCGWGQDGGGQEGSLGSATFQKTPNKGETHTCLL